MYITEVGGVNVEFLSPQINSDGAVARDGRLEVGQRILEVRHGVITSLGSGGVSHTAGLTPLIGCCR